MQGRAYVGIRHSPLLVLGKVAGRLREVLERYDLIRFEFWEGICSA
jgi:hypothetical protein